jgi:hypothetical protein
MPVKEDGVGVGVGVGEYVIGVLSGRLSRPGHARRYPIHYITVTLHTQAFLRRIPTIPGQHRLRRCAYTLYATSLHRRMPGTAPV